MKPKSWREGYELRGWKLVTFVLTGLLILAFLVLVVISGIWSEKWIGRSVAELEKALGKPHQIVQLEHGKAVWEYERYSPNHLGPFVRYRRFIVNKDGIIVGRM